MWKLSVKIKKVALKQMQAFIVIQTYKIILFMFLKAMLIIRKAIQSNGIKLSVTHMCKTLK